MFSSSGYGKAFLYHLKDLLILLVKILITWLVTALSLFLVFRAEVTNFFLSPIRDSVDGLNFLKPLDGLFFYMKMFAIAGLIISLPVVIILLWNYIKPALKDKESKFVGYYMSTTMFLISFAIMYGYYFLMPVSLRFLVGIQVDGVNFNLDAYAYLSFFITLFFALVLVFQLPVLIYGLARTGILPVKTFEKRRKEIFIINVALMVLISPTSDVFSLALFVIPTYGLMELAILLAKIKEKNKDPVSTHGSVVDIYEKQKLEEQNGGDVLDLVVSQSRPSRLAGIAELEKFRSTKPSSEDKKPNYKDK